MHSFAGDAETALACVELGLSISFAGMVTFKKNDALRAVAAQIPLDRLLVETDAPYLAPVPFRGKRNEPAYVRHTAECLASVRGMTPDEIGELTTKNARQLFPFSQQGSTSPETPE
jgi:TatD DNase family protein